MAAAEPVVVPVVEAPAGLLAFGFVLWLPARATTGPIEEIDPAELAD